MIPEAIDEKNIGIDNESDKFIIYYFIDSKPNLNVIIEKAHKLIAPNFSNKYLAQYNPADASLFELDSVTRVLRLITELDRESIDNHEIRVIATNMKEGPQNAKASSMLIVNISVRLFVYLL